MNPTRLVLAICLLCLGPVAAAPPARSSGTKDTPVASAAPAPAPAPVAAPAPAGDVVEKFNGIMQKLDANDALHARLEALSSKMDTQNRVMDKMDGMVEALREQNRTLEKLVGEMHSTQAAAPAATPPSPAPSAPAVLPAPVAAAAATTSSAAPPATDGAVAAVQSNINYVWIIISAAMVFFMQAGFVMLEIGACRAKNTINIVMKSFLDFCICALVFLFVGCPLMFGTSWKGLIGTDGFDLATLPGDHALFVFWFFQVGFAGVSCTILSGAVAERTKFLGYLLYCAFFSAFIYPVIGHWAWGSFGGAFGMGGQQGWLEARGFIDFAGSSVVHACGGACSLAGILAVGPRVGRFGPDGSPRLIAGHNIPLVTLGVLLLWFGWFGFNAGSSLSATSVIGRLVVNTTISPAAAGVAAMVSMWFMQGRPDVNIAMNGALGGAVSITACCAVVTPAAAVGIGLVGGILTTVATIALERWKIDDAVGAVPVHLVCGWWGTLSVAFFNENGFKLEQLGVQALGTASISLYSFTVCFLFFSVIKLIVPVRATEEEQINGLDFTEHAANAYPDFQTTEQA